MWFWTPPLLPSRWDLEIAPGNREGALARKQHPAPDLITLVSAAATIHAKSPKKS
jgi:hypothetical protein